MTVVPSTPLTVVEITKAIDQACLTISKYDKLRCWTRRQRHHSDNAAISPLLYGIVGTTRNTLEDEDAAMIVQATFYFAYSTWDGRVLYVDEIMNVNRTEICSNTSALYIIYQILTNVAITLHCCRQVKHTHYMRFYFLSRSLAFAFLSY
jgi:hypothetical protein